MTDQNKNEIKILLDRYCEQQPSQAKASIKLGVSEATVINIRNNRWESISDDMFRKVAKALNWSKGKWNVASTRDFSALQMLLNDAQESSQVYAVCTPAGSGKTITSRYYASQNPNVYHLECDEFWNPKTFLSKLLRCMGLETTGTTNELVDRITENICKQDCPLIIIDEADKLRDNVLYFFITLYNRLEDRCGIIMLSTSYLAKRIQSGRERRLKGYEEIYSRLGCKFITLAGQTMDCIRIICEANGLSDQGEITRIYNTCEGDLRRVKREVHKSKKTLKVAA